jgi:hypothetical protein
MKYIKLFEGFTSESKINIKSDINNLIEDMKSNGLIKSGAIDGNSSKARGKFKATVYPKVDTTSTLKEFTLELKKQYSFEGLTDTGKRVFKFNKNLYGWIINNEGSSVDIILMRKTPIKYNRNKIMDNFDLRKYLAEGRLTKNSISNSKLKKEIEEACDYLENTSDISQQTIDFIRKMGPQLVDFISKAPK